MRKNEDYKNYYIITRQIGQSGFAHIYEAKNKNNQIKKALKVLEIDLIKQHLISDGKEPNEKEMKPYIDSFYNEIKYMNILQGKNQYNQNAVKLDEYFVTEKEITIVMELCDCNLFDHLTKQKEYNSEDIYDILNQLNNSFEIMVKNGILHRAIRLENILIKYENEEKTKFIVKLKLTSDCIPLNESSENNLPPPRRIFNNRKTYAPEVLDKIEYTEKSDLWSLGILIYLLYFRGYPFRGKFEKEVLNEIQNNIGALKKTNDQDLNDLINNLLTLEPDNRLTWEEYFNHSFFLNNSKNKFIKYYDYNTKNVLGSGGYGIVYKATKKDTGEKRAIKIINKNLYFNEVANYPTINSVIKDLKEEIYIMKILEGINKINKNTVKFYEYFNMEDEFVIVMELCDGNLTHYLDKKEHPFNSEEIYDFLSQLNNTLRIMYENKIAHRDLNLKNILYKRENNQTIFKLSDYGAGKQLLKTLQTISQQIGTISFMAPEMLDNNKKATLDKCDLWSLGVIIYNLHFKRNPYIFGDRNALLTKIREGQKILKESNDYDLEKLIKKLLIEDPNNRLSWKDYFTHPFFNKNK